MYLEFCELLKLMPHYGYIKMDKFYLSYSLKYTAYTLEWEGNLMSNNNNITTNKHDIYKQLLINNLLEEFTLRVEEMILLNI
jgi:hypothetical protein